MFSDLPVTRELGAGDEVLAEYIRKHSPITAPNAGRITAILKPAQDPEQEPEQETELEEAA